MRVCDKEEGRGDRVVGPGDVVWLQYEARRASDDHIFESTYAARLPTFLLKLFYLLGKRDSSCDVMPDGPYVRARVSCGGVYSSSPSSSSVLCGGSCAVEQASPVQKPDEGCASDHQNFHQDRMNRRRNEADTPAAGGARAAADRASHKNDVEKAGCGVQGCSQAAHANAEGSSTEQGRQGREESQNLSPEKGFHPLIPALDEGIRGMRVGGIRELIVPPHLAYPFMCQEVLIYEVHVLWIGDTLPKSDSLLARLKR
ncbi:hypothetical protein NCLIV_027890, partial [Neospora caninum Liverpool]